MGGDGVERGEPLTLTASLAVSCWTCMHRPRHVGQITTWQCGLLIRPFNTGQM